MHLQPRLWGQWTGPIPGDSYPLEIIVVYRLEWSFGWGRCSEHFDSLSQAKDAYRQLIMDEALYARIKRVDRERVTLIDSYFRESVPCY